jgi:molybdopterin/thiamine biosynthesis adenylyltransferase/rhodanese-related sulfurtransferase
MNSVRYSRQQRLPEVGESGQKALENAKILVVGLGGLGCPGASYLAAAGIGTLGLVDGDLIDETNLHRQILFAQEDIGRAKVTVAKRQLSRLNPTIKIMDYFQSFDSTNASALLNEYDLVLDCTDNFEAKFLLNDACVRMEKPLVSASATGFEANLMIVSAKGPCLRCLYPKAETADVGSCNITGVLGAFVGIVGSWQAAEALKLILSNNKNNNKNNRAQNLASTHLAQPELDPRDMASSHLSAVPGQVLFFDFYSSQVRSVQVQRNSTCLCAQKTLQPPIPRRENLYLMPEQVQKLEQYVLVDVRSEEERSVDDSPNPALDLLQSMKSIHRPFVEIVGRDFDATEWAPNQAYILYCRMGKKSILAAQWLRDHGVNHAYGLRV